MANILHIDSSPRGERSISRSLTYEFITSWKDAHPNDTVTYRDLGHHPVPHVDESWIAAAFTPPDAHTSELAEAIQISDTLIDEFLAADRYVFGIAIAQVVTNWSTFIQIDFLSRHTSVRLYPFLLLLAIAFQLLVCFAVLNLPNC